MNIVPNAGSVAADDDCLSVRKRSLDVSMHLDIRLVEMASPCTIDSRAHDDQSLHTQLLASIDDAQLGGTLAIRRLLVFPFS